MGDKKIIAVGQIKSGVQVTNQAGTGQTSVKIIKGGK
jgi:hypothetical protein